MIASIDPTIPFPSVKVRSTSPISGWNAAIASKIALISAFVYLAGGNTVRVARIETPPLCSFDEGATFLFDALKAARPHRLFQQWYRTMSAATASRGIPQDQPKFTTAASVGL